MKSIINLSLVLLFSLSAFIVSAQETKSESIAVSGNCGMCKSTIEKAAKSAGATDANWDKEKKVLALSYPASTSSEKIQQAIAAAGYDTRDFQATDASYKKLPECCQYERKAKEDNASTRGTSCCSEHATAEAKKACAAKCAESKEIAKATKANCCKEIKSLSLN